ncbi:MAG: hypothetical protein IJX27_07610 [Clostridia bacterium]|nr:hypothetical protein [Clostridia bacterium]
MKHDLFSAILWSVVSVMWTVLAINKIAQNDPAWSIVINILVAVLSVANAVMAFKRYKKSK